MRDDFFYANSLEAHCTSYDVTLRFLRSKLKPGAKAPLGDGNPDDFLDSPDIMSVSMSPMHLKAMLPALYQLVTQYEARFGKLGIPADSAAAWEKIFNQDKGK